MDDPLTNGVNKMKKLYTLDVDFIHNKTFTVRADSKEEAIELGTSDERVHKHDSWALGGKYVNHSIREIPESEAKDYEDGVSDMENGYYD